MQFMGWKLAVQGVNSPACSWSSLSSQTLHHPGNLSSQTSLQGTQILAYFHSKYKTTSEQLPKIVIIRGLEEVQSPDIPKVGCQLLRVTLAKNLNGSGALRVTDFLVSLLEKQIVFQVERVKITLIPWVYRPWALAREGFLGENTWTCVRGLPGRHAATAPCPGGCLLTCTSQSPSSFCAP